MTLHGLVETEPKPDLHSSSREEEREKVVGRQLPVKQVVRKLRKPFPPTLQREQGRQGDGICGSAATARLRVSYCGSGGTADLAEKLLLVLEKGRKIFTCWSW